MKAPTQILARILMIYLVFLTAGAVQADEGPVSLRSDVSAQASAPRMAADGDYFGLPGSHLDNHYTVLSSALSLRPRFTFNSCP